MDNYILVFDIGNTNITIGVFNEKELLCNFRIKTNIGDTEDQYFTYILTLLKERNINIKDIKGAIIGSVVPSLNHVMKNLLKKYFKITPLFITAQTKLNIKNRYKNKEEVGEDRIANAVAARFLFKNLPVVIIDFGTAITFDVVDEKGNYLGGVILPGINLSIQSLFLKTAKLPQIDIKLPRKIIGNTTITSIQSGIFNSIIASINYFVENIKKELNAKKIKVVLTGGEVCDDILKKIKYKDIYIDTDFTLKGLKAIYDLNKNKKGG